MKLFIRGFAIALLIVGFAVPSNAQNRGGSGLPAGPGNPLAALEARIAQLEAQVAALQAAAGGLDPAALVGNWSGSRFVGQFGTGVFVEEPGQTFTFNADGTFTAGTNFLPGGHYRLVGQNIVAGTIALQDAHIDGDTLTFYTDNKTSGQQGGSSLGQAVVYVLQRTP